MMMDGFASAMQDWLPDALLARSNTELVTLAILAFVGLITFLSKSLFKKRPKLPYPPGPPPVPFFGNSLDFPNPRKGGHADGKWLEYAKQYGLICSVTMPIIGRFIICADPDLIKHVAVTKNFHKSFTYQLFAPAIGSRSILLLEGKEWAAVRKTFNEGFRPSFLKNVVATMAKKLQGLTESIEEDIDTNVATNTFSSALAYTSDVIVAVAFGEDWGKNDKEPHPARTYQDIVLFELSGRAMNPMLMLFGFKSARRVHKYEQLVDQEMRQVLERRLAAGVSPNSNDICSLAISQMKQKDGFLTEDDKVTIIRQLKTFYFAGHETTAITLSWSMWLLSQHETVLTKLREELKQKKVWTDLAVAPTYAQLQDCQYLDAVIKEALRLYPPATVARYTPDVNETFKGYTIGGAVLIISPYTTHRHPDLWKRPDEFVPERFLDGSEEKLSSKFIPFLRGPRDCIGKYFALTELKLAVSSLVTRYDLECVDPKDRVRSQVTNIPANGAQVKFSKRASV